MYYDLSTVRVIDLENKTADLAYKGGRRCAMHVYALRGRIMEPRDPRAPNRPYMAKSTQHQDTKPKIPRSRPLWAQAG